MGVRVPIRVLPVFVDLPKFYSLIRRPHAGKNIVWIGRFEEEKNPLAAIEVLQQVLKVVPDARLTMIGTGSLGQKLSDRAANLPIMVPLGWQDPRIYLDTADVVLCASWHESWGASIVEALAAHVPVVAPDVGVAKEAGATVVPRERLAEAVTDVLKSGARGKLQLNMLSEKEWAEAWVKTL
jgi:glycosyltransferase involved in cell wall biosynthesis